MTPTSGCLDSGGEVAYPFWRGGNVGTFHTSIEIGDPTGQRYETVEALVDAGATYTTVPAPLLESLGVMPHVRDAFLLADGRRAERDIGRTWVRVDGRAELTLVVFGSPGTQSLLGAYTLEGLRLAADPVGRRLVPVPGLLLIGLSLACVGSRAETPCSIAPGDPLGRDGFTPEAFSRYLG
jgi:predicted aspartyl protease